jgi:hypothetical protein
MAFSVLAQIRPMIETRLLERAQEAYDRIMSDKVRFRRVIQLGYGISVKLNRAVISQKSRSPPKSAATGTRYVNGGERQNSGPERDLNNHRFGKLPP